MTSISVIIPVYNVEKYIERCLRSIADQQVSATVECVLVDDCGQDSSMDLVRRFIAGYVGPIDFRILSHNCNRGQSAARNTGVKSAKGKYIFFVDSDDFIYPNCLQSFVDCAVKYKEPEFVVGGARATEGFQSYSMEGNRNLVDYTCDERLIKWIFLRPGKIPITPWNKLVKKSFLMKNDLFFKEGIMHEDELWNYKVACVLGSLAINKKDTYCYVVRQNSVSSQNSGKKSLQSRLVLWDIMISSIPSAHVDFYVRNIWRMIMGSMCFEKKSDEFVEQCKEKIKILCGKASFPSRVWMKLNLVLSPAWKNKISRKWMIRLDSLVNSLFFV